MAVIGIDLGTTNSLVAVWKDEKVELIKNKLGSELTPSVVSIQDGSILVGQHAKDRLVSNPDMTAEGFKRYMGTNKKIQLGERSFSPEELSSLVIKKLVEDAKNYLKEDIDEAIISVPAYFNNEQRYATKLAAKLAGVKCERIINEPSAAALFCRTKDMAGEQTVLVFDFGGGTLDVSIVDCFENIVEIQSIAGDNHLGGKDFDELIAKKFCEENEIDYENMTDEKRQALLRRAELCKIHLSESEESKLNFRYEDKEYEYTFTNKILLETAGQLFLKMKQVIGRALKDSDYTPKDITDVLPVGGSCNMPVVREYLSHLFKRPVEKMCDGDKIVATGLGVYCGIKARNEQIKDILMTDVCPFSLGTDISNPENPSNHIMSVIIERNSVLPVKATRVYTTNSNAPYFNIYQGESYYVAENVKIGGIGIEEGIKDLSPGLMDVRNEVALTFSYDINGILDVTAKILSTGQEKSISIIGEHNPLTGNDIENRRKNIERIGFADDEENKAVIALATRIYSESVGNVRDKAENILYYFNNVLSTNSPIKIKKAREAIMPVLMNLDEYANQDIFAINNEEDIQEEYKMKKIAVAYDNGQIFEHFGKTEAFKVYNVENDNVTGSEVIESDGDGHGALAAFLSENEVDVLICGGIGSGAMDALLDYEIEVYAGVSGDADAAVEAYINGELESAGITCNHHEEGHTCGNHEEEHSCGGCGGCHGGCGSSITLEGRNVGKTVRTHYRGTFNDGEQFDSSYDRGEPLEFVCGAGMMIRGFDAAVADMEVGQVVDIHLMPEEAYGMPDPQAIFTVELAQLPGAEELNVGEQAYLSNAYGQPFPVKVTAKDDTTITFDANHEMAGKELNFRIELVEVL